MSFVGNDRWSGEFTVEEIGIYEYTIEGWVNHLKNHKTRYPKELKVIVDRKKALFSAWYELFPPRATKRTSRGHVDLMTVVSRDRIAMSQAPFTL